MHYSLHQNTQQLQEKTKRAYLSQEILEAKMKVNSRSWSKLYSGAQKGRNDFVSKITNKVVSSFLGTTVCIPYVIPKWNSLCHKYWWSGVNIIDRHSDKKSHFNVNERILKGNRHLLLIFCTKVIFGYEVNWGKLHLKIDALFLASKYTATSGEDQKGLPQSRNIGS